LKNIQLCQKLGILPQWKPEDASGKPSRGSSRAQSCAELAITTDFDTFVPLLWGYFKYFCRSFNSLSSTILWASSICNPIIFRWNQPLSRVRDHLERSCKRYSFKTIKEWRKKIYLPFLIQVIRNKRQVLDWIHPLIVYGEKTWIDHWAFSMLKKSFYPKALYDRSHIFHCRWKRKHEGSRITLAFIQAPLDLI